MPVTTTVPPTTVPPTPSPWAKDDHGVLNGCKQWGPESWNYLYFCTTPPTTVPPTTVPPTTMFPSLWSEEGVAIACKRFRPDSALYNVYCKRPFQELYPTVAPRQVLVLDIDALAKRLRADYAKLKMSKEHRGKKISLKI